MKRWILSTLRDINERWKIQYLKSLLFIFFILLSPRAASPDTDVASIAAYGRVDAYGKLVKAVVQVESSGDTLAYNPAEGAIGAFQIRQIRLRDYNRRTGKN
jgi:hypothetical protein